MKSKLLEEFQVFLKSEAPPPSELERQLLSNIHQRLNPSLKLAVTKLFGLNAVGSIATLSLCPQYGLSITGGHGLMPYFMNISPAFCFFMCGLLWMVGGQILANFVLSWDERRILSRYYWGTMFSFILFSVLAFACVGTLTLDTWLLYWVGGALAVMGYFGLRSRAKFRMTTLSNVGPL